MSRTLYEEIKQSFYGTPHQLRDKLARIISGQNPDGTPFEFPALEQVEVVAGGGKPSYEHIQNVASANWTITHNLNTYPSVVVIDTAGTTFIPDVDYVNQDQLIVKFVGETSGRASLHS